MTIEEDAERAFNAGDVRGLLNLLSRANGSADVVVIATWLTATNSPPAWTEGTELLRRLADSGNGHAAHNLATALKCPPAGVEPDPAAATRYHALAVLSGFEGTVSSDSAG